MLNTMEAGLFWEAYERGASNSQAILAYMLSVGYGVAENEVSFIEKVEAYALDQLGYNLPRGNEIP